LASNEQSEEEDQSEAP
jgi:hypothetical protein